MNKPAVILVKLALLNKLAFDTMDESGAVWTNRDDKFIKNTITRLTKEKGENQKVTYNLSQEDNDRIYTKDGMKTEVKTTLGELSKNKQLFKNWDRTKGSHGYIMYTN